MQATGLQLQYSLRPSFSMIRAQRDTRRQHFDQCFHRSAPLTWLNHAEHLRVSGAGTTPSIRTVLQDDTLRLFHTSFLLIVSSMLSTDLDQRDELHTRLGRFVVLRFIVTRLPHVGNSVKSGFCIPPLAIVRGACEIDVRAAQTSSHSNVSPDSIRIERFPKPSHMAVLQPVAAADSLLFPSFRDDAHDRRLLPRH